jgi:hypothetical protein
MLIGRHLSSIPERTILLTSSAPSRTSVLAVEECGLALSDGLGEKEIISSMAVEKKKGMAFLYTLGRESNRL